MLVLSRQPGETIIVGGGPPEGCLITLIAMRGKAAVIQIDHGLTPRKRDTRPHTLAVGESTKVGERMSVTVVDVRTEKVRLGILAPPGFAVHRLEVWEAIERLNREARDAGGDAGMAGAPVPRPGGPKLPSLDFRLDEPRV